MTQADGAWVEMATMAVELTGQGAQADVCGGDDVEIDDDTGVYYGANLMEIYLR